MAFVEDTSWGAGISSVMADGPAPRSDLRAWLDQSSTATRPGPASAALSVGDPALLADLGLDEIRLTVDWARLEPEPGHHDRLAIETARARLEAASQAGLTPWVCLHDGPLPGWFSVDEHGFADRRAQQYFWARHVEFVGETFADLVGGWVPVFEPTRWAWQGWMQGTKSPGRRNDHEGFAENLEAILLANVDAAMRLRQDGHPVATAHQITPVFAARDHRDAAPTPDAEAASSALDRTLNQSWLGIDHAEELQVPGRPPVAVPGGSEAFDIIGMTYRHAVATRGDGAVVPYPTTDAGPEGHRWWPEGLRLALEHLAEQVPNRTISVAGLGISTDHEGEREQYLREALAQIEAAAAGGIDVGSIWWETPIDLTPGPGGSGLFDHDRRPRTAATLLTEVIANGTVPG